MSGGTVASQYLAGSASPSGHSISSHSSSARLGPPLVAMGGPHPNPGKARGQRSRASLAPGNRLPACRRQAERKRLDADRMVLGVAAHQLRGTAATRPRQRRQRCRPRRPHRSLRRDAGDIAQPQSADLLAQPGVGAIPGIHQHNPARQTGGVGRPDLLQRNLRLGQKSDRLGDAGRGAALGIGRSIPAADTGARRSAGSPHDWPATG